jgi:hypothetical protein
MFDRNKDGGNVHDMLNFNAAISNLRLEELFFLKQIYVDKQARISPFREA